MKNLINGKLSLVALSFSLLATSSPNLSCATTKAQTPRQKSATAPSASLTAQQTPQQTQTSPQKTAPDTAAARDWDALQSKIKKQESSWKQQIQKAQAAGDMQQAGQLMSQNPAQGQRPQVIAFIKQYPDSPQAFAALMWMMVNPMNAQHQPYKDLDWVLRQFAEHHSEAKGIEQIFSMLPMFTIFGETEAPELLLQRVAREHPDRRVRGLARLEQARMRIGVFSGMNSDDDETQEARSMLEKLSRDFPGDDEPGPAARAELFALNHLRVGASLPPTTGKDVDGHSIDLQSYRGKVLLVIFWSTWCKGCMLSIPAEKDLFAKYQGRPLQLVGVNGDPSPEICRQSIKNEGIPWPVIYDMKPEQDRPQAVIAERWKIQSFPMIFLVDHQGVIRLKTGDIDEVAEHVEQYVQQAEKDRHKQAK